MLAAVASEAKASVETPMIGGKIVLSLNGRPVALKELTADVTLKPGDNEVKVTGAETLPDIDFLEVSAR